MVRDRITITVREWNKTKGAKEGEYVADRYKEGLWNDLMTHFTLPECEDDADTAALRKKVKQWTLTKMAELFKNWKKALWQKYQKTKKTPKFECYLTKQQANWDAFVKYKESQPAMEMSEKTRKMSR